MEEFKVTYNHNKASTILQKLGAEFVKEEILEDLYLIDDGQDIWKISRVNGKIKLVHLENCGDRFEIKLEREIGQGKVFEELNKFFNASEEIIRKDRKHYKLGESKIVLDKIENLGQFVELYPLNNQEEERLFKLFRIESAELINKSYNALRMQK